MSAYQTIHTGLVHGGTKGPIRCDSCGQPYDPAINSQFCPHILISTGVVGQTIAHDPRFQSVHPDRPAAEEVRKQVEQRLLKYAPADSFESWLSRLDTESGAGAMAVYTRAIPDHPDVVAAKLAIATLPEDIATIGIYAIGD